MNDSAVVLLSGGQDSTTCLFWTLERGASRVLALSVFYGQAHALELESARQVVAAARSQYPDAKIKHEVLNVGPILLGSSPLLPGGDDLGQYATVDDLPDGVEPTFVYGRNLLFLVLAANRLAAMVSHGESGVVVTGVAQEDFGGYFDCRQEFVDAMARAIDQGFTGEDGWVSILTPLMDLDKAATVRLAQSLPGCMDALAYSHTCYAGTFPPCGECHACHLRARGFQEAGVEDPIMRRIADK
jgi:7-cyano-7-deazaguanine synthase